MKRFYTEEEYTFYSHDRNVRDEIDEIRMSVDKLTESIRNMIDDYSDLVEEGRALGKEEDEILEDYAGWVEEFENLKNFIEDKSLNI